MHYTWALHQNHRGSPILFFIARQKKKSDGFARATAAKEIDWLERLLISYALDANPKLFNKKATRYLRDLVVPGVINTPQGKSPAASSKLRRTLKLSKK